MLDSSFNPAANDSVLSIATQIDGKILVGGAFTTLAGQLCSRLGRLHPNGNLDTNFIASANDLVSSMTVKANGKIVVGGSFTMLNGQPRDRIGQLNPDGSLDTNFMAGADNAVSSIAVQPDGKILVGGEFTMLGGQMRNSIGRLAAAVASLQTIAIDDTGTTATWSRGGAGPEIEQVTFEQSSDGVTYSLLGNGTRISDGWQLAGTLLPSGQYLYLRARGRMTSGENNGSSGLLESVAYLSRPLYLTSLSRLPSGALEFVWHNPGKLPFNVIATTNLSLPSSNWTVLGSPVLIAEGVYQFTDLGAAIHPQRFYQLRPP
jgi:Domain of unknown function (DUF5122) beta-propeller